VFESFGLGVEADLVYCGAHENPGNTADSLAKVLGQSPQLIINGYQELVETGLAIQSLFPEIVVVGPQHAVDILVARQEAALIASKDRAQQFKASLSKTDTQAPEVETIRGSAAVHDRILAIGAEAVTELATLSPGGIYTAEQIEANKFRSAEMFARKIRSRTIYASSVRNDPATQEYVSWVNEHGGAVRTALSLPLRMIIADRKVAVLPLDRNDAMLGITVHRNPTVVYALQEMFEFIWNASTPLGAASAQTTHGLSSEEYTALELLAVGKETTDIAKLMKQPDRTTRYMIAKIMKSLEAKTRFEAGYRAVKKGWL